MENKSEVPPGLILPREAFLYFPRPDELKDGEGDKIVRKIFEGDTKYEPYELSQLQELKKICDTKKFTIDEYWSDCRLLRFLQATKFKLEKSFKLMSEHDQFRRNSLPKITLTTAIETFLNSGVLYLHGRDHRFRPIMVICPYRMDEANLDLDAILDGCAFFLEQIIKNLFLPGQVENWVIIMDLNFMSFFTIFLGAIAKIEEFLQRHYRSRLFKMYMLNSPASVYIPWKIVCMFLEEHSIKKVGIHNNANVPEMFTHIHPEQLEEQFGGKAPNVTKNFWPPVQTSSYYLTYRDDPAELLLTKAEYRDRLEKGLLKNYKINPDFTKPVGAE